MTKEEMKSKADELRAKIGALEEDLGTLLDSCPHEFVEFECGVGHCIICERNDFWFCMKSPDHVCHYPDYNDLEKKIHTSEYRCIYCGRLGERFGSGYSEEEEIVFAEEGSKGLNKFIESLAK